MSYDVRVFGCICVCMCVYCDSHVLGWVSIMTHMYVDVYVVGCILIRMCVSCDS